MGKDRDSVLLRWDKRMIDKHIQNGTMTREEYEQHLKSLEDLSHNVERVEIENTDKEEDLDDGSDAIH